MYGIDTFVRYLIGMINYLDYRYSKDKGATKAGDVFASSINMGPSDYLYSSDRVENEIIGTGDGSETNFKATLPWSPVLLDTFTIESSDGSTIIGVCDGAGAITGTGISSGTLTVAGALDITLSSALANGVDLVVNYRFNNEDVRSDGFNANPAENYIAGSGASAATGQAAFTNVPEVELKINSIPVTAQARTLRSFWALTA